MNKKFIFTLIAVAVVGCENSASTKKSIKQSQLEEPIAKTTPVSKIATEVAPSSIPTFQAFPELNPTAKPVIKSLQPSPLATPTVNSKITPGNPDSVTKSIVDTSNTLGCGKVDENYKIKVATIAIANYNPQSLQGLSESQIKNAVKQSITNYPERAEGLVAEYRSINCGAKTKSSAVDAKQFAVNPSSIIQPESVSCKELKARGITNIRVASNPWASRLDKDADGFACESK